MRVDQIKRQSTGKRPPLKAQVLRYLNEHTDEVFGYRDVDLARELGAKPSALGFTLWSLHEQGLIDKQQVDGRVYFGSRDAIQKLRETRIDQDDPLQRARRIRKQIFARVGYIDTRQLLEDVREGRWD